MVDMEVPIEVYKCLSDVAKRHNVKQVDWAKAAEEKQPRIAELERILRMSRGEQEKVEIGRAFTIQKMHHLYLGLKKILGERLMKKELDNCLNHETDPYRRIIIMALAMYGAEDKAFIVEADKTLTAIYNEHKK